MIVVLFFHVLCSMSLIGSHLCGNKHMLIFCQRCEMSSRFTPAWFIKDAISHLKLCIFYPSQGKSKPARPQKCLFLCTLHLCVEQDVMTLSASCHGARKRPWIIFESLLLYSLSMSFFSHNPLFSFFVLTSISCKCVA